MVRLEHWAWYSIALNVALGLAHGLITLRSGSLAVATEVLHNVVDLISAIALLVGLRLATWSSARFPYGLHKVENIVALSFAGLIMLTAYEIGRGVVFGSASDVEARGWMLAVVAVTMAAPLVFSYFELRVVTEANSPTLSADARDYRVHAATTGLVFVVLVSTWTDLPIDRVAAALIIVVIVKTGCEVFLTSRDNWPVVSDRFWGRLAGCCW